jgi:SAM-dependent methyltransferase
MGEEKYRGLLKEKPEWGRLATFVPNKRLPVYNWLYFREGFARDEVFNLLDLFRVGKGKWVLDPYCGSGTTLLACRERGVNSVGTDLLPLAVLASRAKTRDYEVSCLKESARELFGKKFRKTGISCPYRRFFNRHVLEDVVFFRQAISSIRDRETREFFLLGLVSSAVRASWIYKDGNVLRVRKHPVSPFRKFFKRRISRMIREAGKFSGRGKAVVKLSDPAKLDVWDETIDAVITSPPYLNQIDYSKVYSLENWIVGENAALPSYLGPGSEERYFKDLGEVLREMFRVCKKGAEAGIIVGNAYFPGEDRIVESDLRLAGLGEEAGFRARKILVLNRRFALQRRTIKRGVLRESLVLLEK